MRIIEALAILLGGNPSGQQLINKLLSWKQKFPDIGPSIDELIGKLNGIASDENKGLLGMALWKEINDIRQGKLDPRDPPSAAF